MPLRVLFQVRAIGSRQGHILYRGPGFPSPVPGSLPGNPSDWARAILNYFAMGKPQPSQRPAKATPQTRLCLKTPAGFGLLRRGLDCIELHRLLRSLCQRPPHDSLGPTREFSDRAIPG